jgi:hypothetical protein
MMRIRLGECICSASIAVGAQVEYCCCRAVTVGSSSRRRNLIPHIHWAVQLRFIAHGDGVKWRPRQFPKVVGKVTSMSE